MQCSRGAQLIIRTITTGTANTLSKHLLHFELAGILWPHYEEAEGGGSDLRQDQLLCVKLLSLGYLSKSDYTGRVPVRLVCLHSVIKRTSAAYQ
eukprot:991144-Pelagomonas_calceolata.AAC.1